ncbi:MAG: hypothetical protein R3253_14020 [Longimicrobiales bacterium]|nr:hypothetical protein [Longimicrobiales bacterium]
MRTLEPYAALLEPDEESVSELVRGALVSEPRPGRAHGRLQSRLSGMLDRVLRHADTLEGEDVLFGFSLPLTVLFDAV